MFTASSMALMGLTPSRNTQAALLIPREGWGDEDYEAWADPDKGAVHTQPPATGDEEAAWVHMTGEGAAMGLACAWGAEAGAPGGSFPETQKKMAKDILAKLLAAGWDVEVKHKAAGGVELLVCSDERMLAFVEAPSHDMALIIAAAGFYKDGTDIWD